MGHYTIVFYILSPTQATIEFVISCVLLTIDIIFLVHDVLLCFLATIMNKKNMIIIVESIIYRFLGKSMAKLKDIVGKVWIRHIN